MRHIWYQRTGTASFQIIAGLTTSVEFPYYSSVEMGFGDESTESQQFRTKIRSLPTRFLGVCIQGQLRLWNEVVVAAYCSC